MRLMSRIFTGLGVFLLIDAIVYTIHSRDYDGLALILTTAGGGLLIGSYLLQSMQRAQATLAEHPEGITEEEPHVEPTIWPLVFAVSMIGLVIGAVGSRWVLVIGVIVLVIALVGWALDIRRQWRHHAEVSQGLPHQAPGEAG